MKKIAIFMLVVSLYAVIPSAALATTTLKQCEALNETLLQYSRCLDYVKGLVDREMQTWINNQTFILEEHALVTGRHSALTMFRRSQKNFTTFRENNCRWQYLAKSPNRSAEPAFKKCYILVTQYRINELTTISDD
jgi:uncharacterized protein YecT (DUF1311 family)